MKDTIVEKIFSIHQDGKSISLLEYTYRNYKRRSGSKIRLIDEVKKGRVLGSCDAVTEWMKENPKSVLWSNLQYIDKFESVILSGASNWFNVRHNDVIEKEYLRQVEKDSKTLGVRPDTSRGRNNYKGKIRPIRKRKGYIIYPAEPHIVTFLGELETLDDRKILLPVGIRYEFESRKLATKWIKGRELIMGEEFDYQSICASDRYEVMPEIHYQITKEK